LGEEVELDEKERKEQLAEGCTQNLPVSSTVSRSRKKKKNTCQFAVRGKNSEREGKKGKRWTMKKEGDGSEWAKG